jgi:hypothetical protein
MASIVTRLYQVTDTSPRQAMPVVVYTLTGLILLLAALLLSVATTLLSLPAPPTSDSASLPERDQNVVCVSCGAQRADPAASPPAVCAQRI